MFNEKDLKQLSDAATKGEQGGGMESIDKQLERNMQNKEISKMRTQF